MAKAQNPSDEAASATGGATVHASTSGPLVAAVVTGAVLAGAMVFGGAFAYGESVSARAAAAEQVDAKAPPKTESPTKTPEPGEAPNVEGSGDPTTPPDRDSDQKLDAPPSETVYTIQPGDTLTSISAQHGIGIDSLAEYNSIRDADVLSESATLVIPPVDWLPVPPMD